MSNSKVAWLQKFYTPTALAELREMISGTFSRKGENAKMAAQILTRSALFDHKWLQDYMNLASSAKMVLFIALPANVLLKLRALGSSAEAQNFWRKIWHEHVHFVDAATHEASLAKAFPLYYSVEGTGVNLFFSILLDSEDLSSQLCYRVLLRFDCSFCGQFTNASQLCQGCKSEHYCNQTCQKQHWNAKHSAQCSEKAERGKLALQQLHDQNCHGSNGGFLCTQVE